MLILGHVGITCGVALAAEEVALRARHGGAGPQGFAVKLRHTTALLARHVDLRLLMVASLLPDIIDKPLGLLVLGDVYGSGRLFCHALIFPVALAAAGLLLWHVRHVSALLILAYGAGLHLMLDAMWRTPAVLFWPITAMPAHAASPDGWLQRVLEGLLSNPATYVPEIAGAIMLLPLAYVIIRETGPVRFLRSGTVELH
ncbi:MAG: metal-dependent hydrolase [Dehalococcoidia bacterium]|nr:metal-dependent hydrolase [Dehalococcoidia bacterium]